MSKNRKTHKKPEGRRRNDVRQPVMTPGLAYAITMANKDYEQQREMRRVLIANKQAKITCAQHLVDTENWFYASICLALHREFGFGSRRILRTIEIAQYIHNENVESGLTDSDLWKMVKKETGLSLVDHDTFK